MVQHELAPLASRFPASRWPEMRCGCCGTGQLSPVGELHREETARSKRLQAHEGWEVDWVEGLFHASLRCGNPGCEEIAVAIGGWEIGPDPRSDGNRNGQWDDYLLLRAITPALALVRFPGGTPERIRDLVDAASQVVWAQPTAAANRLRVAVEELLTERGVKRYEVRKGSSRRRLPTHARIVSFGEKHSDAAHVLESVKWIGNQGSHEESLTVEDVLLGAKLFERALEIVYDTTAVTLARIAKDINKRRGIAPGRPMRSSAGPGS